MLTIQQDVKDGIYKTYYNVKFSPITFYDYVKLLDGLRKAVQYADDNNISDNLQIEQLRNIFKKFIPFTFGGDVMDFYDVSDLYANNLGLKTVPTTDDDGINISHFILQYYDSNIPSFYGFIKKTIAIYDYNDRIGDVANGINIGDAKAYITFITEFDQEYGKYKNMLTVQNHEDK